MRTNYSLFLCILLATCTLQAIIVTNSLPSIVKINSNQYIISIESSNVLADPTQQQSTIKQTSVAQESTSTSKTVSSSGESQLQSILSSLTSVPIKIASSGPSSTAITVDSSTLYDTTTQQQQSASDSSVKPVAAQKILYPGIPNIVASAPTPVSITSSTPKVGLGNIATTPTITTTAPTSTAPIIGLANPTMTSKWFLWVYSFYFLLEFSKMGYIKVLVDRKILKDDL